MEQLANNAESTLDGAIDNVVTSIDVNDASSFPLTGNFRIVIGDELILVTSRSGNTLTVTRGYESTTAASHLDGAAVKVVLTKGSLEQLFSDYNVTGTLASLPSAGKAGRWYTPTDSHVKFYDNGSDWDRYGLTRKLTAPPGSGWSTVNTQNQTVTGQNDGILFVSSTSATAGLTGYFRNLPSAPYVATLGFTAFPTTSEVVSGQFFGMALYNSGTNAAVCIYNVLEGGTPVISIDGFNNLNTFNSTYSNRKGAKVGFEHYFRIEDNNTDRIFYTSTDGINFAKIFSHGRTTHTTPDQIGFVIATQNGGGAKLIHYDV